jgi:hypothetical protein
MLHLGLDFLVRFHYIIFTAPEIVMLAQALCKELLIHLLVLWDGLIDFFLVK